MKDLDGLNYLAGYDLDFVEEQVFLGTLETHADSGVSVITVDCGVLTEEAVGELIYFLELGCGISAYILGVNPFEQLGAEACRENVLRLLGKPETEE